MSDEDRVSWIDRLNRWRKRQRSGPLVLNNVADAGARPTAGSGARNARDQAAERAFPRFQSTAGDLLNSKLSDAMTSVRLRLRSAFTPSQPIVDRRLFAGRTDMLTALIRSIEDERLHTVIYGERGIGKTSLLHVLTAAAREAGYLVSYVSCGAGSDFDEMFRAVAGDIPLLFHRDYGPTSSEAERGDTFATLLGESPVSVRQASDLLSKVVGTRALIVLDEFDRVESAQFRLSIAEFLKNLSDRSVRVQLVIAGVAANLTELVEHIPSIQRSIFALEVPRMTEAETRHLVRNGEDASGVKFAERAVQLIAATANGLPYLASLISHHAGMLAIGSGRLDVTPADVDAALSIVLTEFKGRISKRSQVQIAKCVSEGSHRTLGALAGVAQLAGGSFEASDIVALRASVNGVARCQALVEKLAAEGVLISIEEDELGRRYRFVEESVPAYLWMLVAQSGQVDSLLNETAIKPAPRAEIVERRALS